MLRRVARGLVVLLTGFGVLVALSVGPATAGSGNCAEGEVWNESTQTCIVAVEVEDSGDESDGGDGDDDQVSVGDIKCVTKEFGDRESYEVPCYDQYHGYWSNADSCYWEEVSPPPPPTDKVWEGNYPEGAIYEPYCLPRINVGQNNCWEIGGPSSACREWRATPPWEVPDPGELARQALQRMRLTGPDIGMAPPEGSTGVVRLPVWLWNNVSDRTWTSTSEPACDAGLCVTVTATAESITWDMGNGDTVDCDEGTPYREGGDREPTCSYTYEKASTDQPGGRYEITATTHWSVIWQANNGLSGELEPFGLSSRAELGMASVGPILVR